MKDSLKIVMTADTISSVWTYVMDLCGALQEYNTEIHLITMGALLDKDKYGQIKQLSNIHLYESNYKLEWMKDPWDDVQKAREWVETICKKVNPDIIHFNNFGQVDGNWNCPVVTVYHSCIHTWWYEVKGENPPDSLKKYDNILEKAIQISDVIVAPSKGMLELAEGVFGKFKVSQIIYNGTDVRFKDISHKETYIFTAARVWDESKNMKLLIAVAADLSWPVYIAGNENDEENAYEAENVTFIGDLPQSEIEGYMAKASIFVMPTKYQPFGMAILEAATAGCALALGDIITLREIWGDAALYFDPENDEDARQTMQTLIDDKELRIEMSERAMVRAKEFSAVKMAAEYMKLYHQLIEKKLLQTTPHL